MYSVISTLINTVPNPTPSCSTCDWLCKLRLCMMWFISALVLSLVNCNVILVCDHSSQLYHVWGTAVFRLQCHCTSLRTGVCYFYTVCLQSTATLLHCITALIMYGATACFIMYIMYRLICCVQPVVCFFFGTTVKKFCLVEICEWRSKLNER